MQELFVETAAQLQHLCERLQGGRIMALDTEFMREKTYTAQLCLLQIAAEDLLACVDPLAITDLTPLLTVIHNPEVIKVFHSARQDLELFFDLTGAVPAPVFDTQIAATLLGYGEQVGYAALVEQMLDVKLAKTHTRTDWSQRPLARGQIEYALDDVRYLPQIYARQHAALEEKGRLHWLDADFAALTDPLLYRQPPDVLWQKVRGAHNLRGVQLAVLQQLAAWREQRARESNRPRRWVVRDDVLLELARQMPASATALNKIQGVDAHLLRHTDAIIAMVQHAQALPREQWPRVTKHVRLTPQQEAELDLLMAIVRARAQDNHVAPALLASRKDLECLVLGKNDCAVNGGWRLELVGHELQAVMRGEREVFIDNGLVTVRERAGDS